MLLQAEVSTYSGIIEATGYENVAGNLKLWYSMVYRPSRV